MTCEHCDSQIAKYGEFEGFPCIAKCDNCLEQWRITKVADEPALFILCKAPECFPEHEQKDIVERVKMCALLSDAIGAVNWD